MSFLSGNPNRLEQRFGRIQRIDQKHPCFLWDLVGYEIELKEETTGALRCIEVKARLRTAKSTTVTRNELVTALNKKDQFILAVVLHGEDKPPELHYTQCPFECEPDFGETDRRYQIEHLLEKARRQQ